MSLNVPIVTKSFASQCSITGKGKNPSVQINVFTPGTRREKTIRNMALCPDLLEIFNN